MAKARKKSKPAGRSRKTVSRWPKQAVAAAYIVSPANTKHGPRLGGKIKFAQMAILELYGRPIEHVNGAVVQQVNTHLEKHPNPDCRLVCPLSRQTIERAGEKLWQVNHER